MRRLLPALLLALAARAPAAPRPEGRRLADWLAVVPGVPDQPLIPGLRARRYELPGVRARLPDWPVVAADLRGARGSLEVADRRLDRRLELRWLAARPGQLEAMVHAWMAEAGGEGRAFERPVPVKVGALPGLEVVGRRVVSEEGQLRLRPRRDRSRREHHWFWYDPGEARVHALHLELPGGDVVLGELLGAPLRDGLAAAPPGAPPALAAGLETWTARVMGLQLDLPAWTEGRPPLHAKPPASEAWYIVPSGNAGRRQVVAARGDQAAVLRLEWRPMPRERTAEQVPVPSPGDPAGAAHDSWSLCGHPARRTRFDRAGDKAIRWSQELAWYCPESQSEYRLGVGTEEDFAAGLALMDELPERVRCHLPAARGWKPEAGVALTRVGE